MQRGDGEIFFIVETKSQVQQKIKIGEIKHRAEGVHTFDDKTKRLPFLVNVHGALVISESA